MAGLRVEFSFSTEEMVPNDTFQKRVFEDGSGRNKIRTGDLRLLSFGWSDSLIPLKCLSDSFSINCCSHFDSRDQNSYGGITNSNNGCVQLKQTKGSHIMFVNSPVWLEGKEPLLTPSTPVLLLLSKVKMAVMQRAGCQCSLVCLVWPELQFRLRQLCCLITMFLFGGGGRWQQKFKLEHPPRTEWKVLHRASCESPQSFRDASSLQKASERTKASPLSTHPAGGDGLTATGSSNRHQTWGGRRGVASTHIT